MIRNENFEKFKELRRKFEFLSFENYSIVKENKGITLQYEFNLNNLYKFTPTLFFPQRDFYSFIHVSTQMIDNLVFHIGMIELISYWKAACPKKIIIKPHSLNESQTQWWKKLYFNGLGEFMYLNSIETNIDDLLEIISEGEEPTISFQFDPETSTIVPIGGGKDSIVTLELMKASFKKVRPFLVNPRGAMLQTIETAGFTREQCIEVQRTIDPQLLKLNSEGFLNGHTPFSAVLAFTSLFAALLTNQRNIALSNESSANESTVKDSFVNHQYSKSLEFEEDFRNYTENFISPNFNYFSFLRPLSEIQIAKLFSVHDKYHHIFKSCNSGSKTDSWCGTCPKCLFTYIILSPFIPKEKLIEIWNKNLFEDSDLQLYFDQLTGKFDTKPFECVGTVKEVNAALVHTIKNYKNQPLPYLLDYYKNSELYKQNEHLKVSELFRKFERPNYLECRFEDILKLNLLEHC